MVSTVFAVLAAIQIHVAPHGNDAAPGTPAAPLRTLEGARDALRRARAARPDAFAQGGAEVVLADGVYAQAKTLELTAADGGTARQPVVWRAAHRGRAVVSGGVTLTAWRAVEDGKALALLGGEARRHVRVATLGGAGDLPGFTNGGCGTPERLCTSPVSLFCEGRRLPQARWPNDGYARTGANVGAVETSHDASFCRSGVFVFDSPRLARWAQEPDLWMYGLWVYEWADATVRVRGVDVAAKRVSVDTAPIGFGIKAGGQFRALNALSEIDAPGEWALDRATRRLFCWLPHEGAAVTAAFSETLVRAVDVAHVSFEDLVFAAARRPALVFRRARSCTLSGSTVRQTSSWGCIVDGGVSNRVVDCDFHDLGEGGILLAGGEDGAPACHVADNNHIHHFGEVVPNYRPGVQLRGVGSRATHNLIHHTRHQAIAFDGSDHYIGFNVCHDCCTYNDDAGAVYCCQRDWTKRGTVIEHNLIHMTGKQPRTAHTEGVYLDDWSAGVTVRGNIINRASKGVYIGGGHDNRVYGNLILNCAYGLSLGSRGVDSFARPYAAKGAESKVYKGLKRYMDGPHGARARARHPNMARALAFADPVSAHDAHFNVLTNNVLVGCHGGVELQNWRKVAATCCVTNNLVAADDPGLADYAGMDWSLRPGSEGARRLGPLRFAEMGLYASARRASPAVRFGEGVTPPRPLGGEYALASVRIDLRFDGELPEGTARCASDLQGCTVPDWARGRRIVASFGAADLARWQSYRFSFTPSASGRFAVIAMGARGEKTLYDDVRVDGTALLDGGFEAGTGWNVPKAVSTNDHRHAVCNTRRPWGVVTAEEAGVPAAEGARMWCGNDLINAAQGIQCRAGVPVTVSFKARAFPLAD